MNTPKQSPSLNRVRGQSDSDLAEEIMLRRLEELIHGLAPNVDNDSDPSVVARGVYENFCMARMGARATRKASRASYGNVAKQLKQIASGSTTLLRRLSTAHTNVFGFWAADLDDDAAEMPVQKWLKLKSLLIETAARATRASRTAGALAKNCPEDKAPKGRPEDVVAAAMTLMAAEIYEEWTGELALRSISRDDGTAGGGFHNWLTELFEILGIAASPDYSNARLQRELAKQRKSKA